jgi:predicted RNA binding protein YcfA (HicA-like mRNA interferase family)
MPRGYGRKCHHHPMTPKLPVVSGQQLIRALQKFGYLPVRQKGSHVHASVPLARARIEFMTSRDFKVFLEPDALMRIMAVTSFVTR